MNRNSTSNNSRANVESPSNTENENSSLSENTGNITLENKEVENSSYGQILKSSTIVGGSSFINIGIGIVRTKFMAILLGPSGVGMIGLYTAITDLTQSISCMGINSSGVRQIADAVGSGDDNKIAKTTQVLRRTALFLGILGAVFLFSFAPQISSFTFNNNDHVNDIKILSLVIFFSTVSGGQSALIQGLRRISDLAWMGILGTFFGTIISVTAVYHLGQEGIALSLVLIASMNLAMSWLFSRKITIKAQALSKRDILMEQSKLLKLGFAFMISGLILSITAYLVRMIIVREIDYNAAGLYQSAWALGGMYIGIILQAMGADFYPRLTAVANNNPECIRLVNEQTHIGILLSCPGIMATLTLAPLIIDIFYTAQFQGAVELLRWLCLGMALRVISWPIGFIIIAKGAQNFYIISELSWALVYLALVWICVHMFELNGIGIAFFGSYLFHIFINFVIVKKLCGFYFSKVNVEIIFLSLAIIVVVFCSYYFFQVIGATLIGFIATLLISLYAIEEILSLVNFDKLPRIVQKALRLLPFTSSAERKNIASQPKTGKTGKFNAWLSSSSHSSSNTKTILVIFITMTILFMILQWCIIKFNILANLNIFHTLNYSL
jgi:PST family polysaccharide transporter